MTSGLNLLTHSRMQCARVCPRKHYLSYNLGIRKERISEPLRIGSAFHRGNELVDRGYSANDAILEAIKPYENVPGWATDDDSRLDWAIESKTVERLLHAYFWLYQNYGLEVIEPEQNFEIPIVNPDTGAKSKIFRLAGKIDKIVKLPDGRLAVFETKTTSDPLEDDSNYWTRLKIDSQVSLYVYAARQIGYNVECILYDTIRKPATRPKMLTQTDTAQFFATHTYCNERFLVTCEGGSKWFVNGCMLEVEPGKSGRPAIRETVDMWGARLTADIVNRPVNYFARKEIPRLEADLKEFERDLWHTQKLLREADRGGFWPRNTAACLHPYQCEYTAICFQSINPLGELPPGFVRVSNIHQELGETNDSRIASESTTATNIKGAACEVAASG